MENIKFIVNLCFKNSGKQYIRVNRGECYYTDEDTGITFRKEEVLDLMESIVDTAYVKFAGCVYKQVSGVPMGSNCSPLLADLTLLALEFKYCMKEKPRFTVFRYVDDVLVLNCPNFDQLVPEIYPPELILSVTSSQNCAPFLDMRLELKTEKLHIGWYNKTNDFDFPVIWYGSAESNVSSQVCYQVFTSEILRLARICDDLSEFSERFKCLFRMFLENGSDINRLFRTATKFCAKNQTLLLKFGFCKRRAVSTFLLNICG